MSNERAVDVEIMEVGPREGFQFEKTVIATEAKASLINALAQTGVREIQAVSFVSRKTMPRVADAEEVMALVTPTEGVDFTALWFSEHGFARSRTAPNLTARGLVTACASPAFTQRNWGMDDAGLRTLNLKLCELYAQHNLPVRISIAASFGCNWSGRVDPGIVLGLLEQSLKDVSDAGLDVSEVALADTMAWGNPRTVPALTRRVMAELGTIPVRLHLHDTRGLGLTNALAGFEAGVRHFDTAIAGLGGCPFAGHKGAAGNIATEDFFYMCEALGIRTGLDADKVFEAGRLAEAIVQHPASSRTLRGGIAPLEFMTGKEATEWH